MSTSWESVRPVLGVGMYRSKASSINTVLSQALRLGIRYIDTAPNYMNGLAEKFIKTVIAEGTYDLHKLSISTKVGYTSADVDVMGGSVGRHCLRPDYVYARVSRSLKDLPDLPISVFLHNPEHLFEENGKQAAMRGLADAFAVLQNLFTEKKIVEYGVATWSGFDNHFRLDEVLETATKLSAVEEIGFKSIQLPASFLRTGAISDALIHRRGVLAEARQAGLKVFASSPFAGGRLPGDLPRDISDWLAPCLSRQQACLAFLSATKLFDVILVGTSQAARLGEIARFWSSSGIAVDRLIELLEIINHES